VLISEFYPSGLCSDEYISLASSSFDFISLADWQLSDGEGSIRFLAGTNMAPEDVLVVSFNSSSYLAAFGSRPDIALDDPLSSASVEVSGTFRLADDGDSLALLSPTGVVEDFVVYGDCSEAAGAWAGAPVPVLKDGEVAKRVAPEGAFVDTDCALDWMPFREHRYGYTELAQATDTVPAGGLVAFTSPDSSLDAVVSEIGSAVRSVKACAYEFGSSAVCQALVSALGREVAVDVLVDGSPAGGMDDEQLVCLSVLASAGASVRLVSGSMSEDVVRHVFALHAKYLVIDGVRCVVLSENLVESGLPTDRYFGNRGWGVAFTSPKLAGYLSGMFDEDSRVTRPDVIDWAEDPRCSFSESLPASPATDHPEGLMSALRSTTDAVVTLVPSPDGSLLEPFLSAHLRQGRLLRIEQFQADMDWESRWSGTSSVSPLLTSLLDSLAEGACADMLLDSSWFNLDRNERVARYLSDAASVSSLDGRFELLDQSSPITVLHNKGLVIDSHISVVSSNNWVSASFARNRELAAFVDSAEVASYFSHAFDLDWIPDVTPPVVEVADIHGVVVGENATLDVRSCRDDRAVANISWDIGSDGTVDAWGTCCSFATTVPGEIDVTVYVEDCWGNTAYGHAVVEVVLPGSPSADREGSEGIGLSWLVPLAIGAALLLPRVLRPRRARKAFARKVNHTRGGSSR
jgi:hypothetical protein